MWTFQSLHFLVKFILLVEFLLLRYFNLRLLLLYFFNLINFFYFLLLLRFTFFLYFSLINWFFLFFLNLFLFNFLLMKDLIKQIVIFFCKLIGILFWTHFLYLLLTSFQWIFLPYLRKSTLSHFLWFILCLFMGHWRSSYSLRNLLSLFKADGIGLTLLMLLLKKLKFYLLHLIFSEATGKRLIVFWKPKRISLALISRIGIEQVEYLIN